MELLKSLYFDPNSPCAYAGASALYREAKKNGIKKYQVDEFLEKQEAYTLHKYVRRKFPRNRTFTTGMDSDWQADLADMQRLSKFNDGYNFLLVCVDVLSKYAWVETVKNKTAKEVATAFERILKQGRKPWRLYTDKGKEFIGKPFQDMLESNDIQFIKSESPDVKASIAENFMKPLKTRIWRYFTKNKTYRYLDVLPKIVEGLNKRYHRVIKRRPVDVNFDNEYDVWKTLYGEKNIPRIKFRFNVGDRVRIVRKKEAFEQGYLENFTKEIFTITKRIERYPPVYKLVDWNKEPLTGIFYEPELVKVYEGEIYEIDKVIRRRTRKGIKEALVSWKGYPAKFNQWIPMSDIVSK